MSSTIDITGIPKGLLLEAMVRGTNFPSAIAELSSYFGDTTSAETVATAGRIDYYKGKPIKTDLRGNTVEPFLYDRDAGSGKLARIVLQLRNAYPLV
jgi:hypothetical protein